MTDLYAQAQAYAARGWSIIPLCANKIPALRTWKKYQRERPGADLLRAWFVEGRGIIGKLVGLGVVCGKVSGGLVVRDFDKADSYERWAARNPALARRLPTVETGRGYHVYFRWTLGRIVELPDGEGELRGAGQVCLPPTVHPTGKVYRWLIPPSADALAGMLDPVAAGLAGEDGGRLAVVVAQKQCPQRQFRTIGGDIKALAAELGIPDVTQRQVSLSPPALCDTETQKHRNTETQEIQAIVEVAVFDLETTLKKTLPTGEGGRNRAVFELCRELKARPEYAAADPVTLRPIMERWHALALPIIGTKPFEDTWADFLYAWPRVKYAAGVSPMDAIVKRAAALPFPPEAQRYEQEPLRALVRLCRVLQDEAGDKPFHLDCRTAGASVGVDRMTAARWLNMLAVEGILRVVTPGSRGHATEYRYAAGFSPTPHIRPSPKVSLSVIT